MSGSTAPSVPVPWTGANRAGGQPSRMQPMSNAGASPGTSSTRPGSRRPRSARTRSVQSTTALLPPKRRDRRCWNRLAAQQFTGHGRQPIVLALCKAILDPQVASLNIACLREALSERRSVGGSCCLQERAKKSDHWHRRLLRPRIERPSGGSAAKQRDEVAPYHSITSLAAETKSGEIAIPRAWAVRRLITKSNCDEALMGRSPGLAPRRIRST